MAAEEALTITVKKVEELTAAELSEWQSLRIRIPTLAGPLLSVQFFTALGHRLPNLKIAVVEREGRPAAFLAYDEAAPGVGIPPGWPANDFQALLYADEEIPVEPLLAGAGLDILYFDHLYADQAAFRASHPSNRHHAHVFFIGVSDTVERHFERSKNFRYNVRRARHSFVEEFGHEPAVSLLPLAPEILELVLSWKEEHYSASRIMQHVFEHHSTSLFDILPWMKDFLRELYMSSSPEFGISLAVLPAKGSIISGEVMLRATGWVNSWFAGYDRQRKHLSTGIMLSTELLRTGLKLGIDTYDLGYGDESYKRYLSNAQVPLVTAVVVRDGFRSQLATVNNRLVAALSAATGSSG